MLISVIPFPGIKLKRYSPKLEVYSFSLSDLILSSFLDATLIGSKER